MTEKDTVAMHFVAAAVARLAAPVRDRVLAAAGIPPGLLGVASARVPAAAFSALWLAIATAIDDEFFALDRRRMKVGSFALVARSALATADLGQALRQTLRGFAVLLDDIGGELLVAGGQAQVVLSDRIADPAARRFADETLLVMVHGLLCWLGGRRIGPLEIRFAHPRPAHAAEYALMFSERMVFDAPATVMVFDAAQLAAPVVQDARTLRTFLHSAPQSVFLRYRNAASWTARVRRRLRNALDDGDWPVLAELARSLHLAPPTLRRRLEGEGSSWQGIKDGLRRDAAIHDLCHTALSVAEIGARLGFRETSAFHRAFRKWTGARPGQYRRASRHGGASPARACSHHETGSR